MLCCDSCDRIRNEKRWKSIRERRETGANIYIISLLAIDIAYIPFCTSSRYSLTVTESLLGAGNSKQVVSNPLFERAIIQLCHAVLQDEKIQKNRDFEIPRIPARRR